VDPSVFTSFDAGESVSGPQGATHSLDAYVGPALIVVFGATGNIGQATAEALRKQGASVRAVVRDRSRAGRLEESGCEIAVADLRDPDRIAAAIDGGGAVQVIFPTAPQADDAVAEMRATIDAVAAALRTIAPPVVLAISDYGAELDVGTGVTLTFNYLEMRLGDLPGAVTFVRSAEHMQNWARQIPAALRTGTLESLHHPLTKLFPTVSAPDVGMITAELLLDPPPETSPRVVHVEGPRRYTPLDVAAALTDLAGREIVARELPRDDWEAALSRGGLSAGYARLIAELFDSHNAGRIDVAAGGEVRRGTTELRDVIASLLQR
jgi:NAD(P)H dehydrogenase (quinone)